MFRFSKTPLNIESGGLTRYLEEIGKIPLLTPKEEKVLAKKMWQGDEKAKATLIQANLRFVVTVARGYLHYGLPLSDLISEGNLGLIEAAERFDSERGFKFISYAVWWIRHRIMKFLHEQGHVMRIPEHQASLSRRIYKTSRYLEQEFEASPSLEDISQELDLEPWLVSQTIAKGRRAMSLDASISEQDDDSPTTLYEVTPDTQTPPPDDPVVSESISNTTREILETLNDPLEVAIVKLYYGLNGNEAMTLEEIGERFNLTRERVRQIKDKALRRLKHPNRQRKLAELANA